MMSKDRFVFWLDRNLLPASAGLWLAITALVFMLVLIVNRAEAASADLSWVAPTTRVDSTPLPTTEIVGYRVEWGLCTATNTVPAGATVTDVVGPVLGTALTLPANGKYCFRVATRATGSAPGEVLVSAYTNVVWKTWVADPNPPSLFAVAHRAVYDLKINTDGSYALRINVGTVPIGTQCGSTVIATGSRGNYYEVQRDDVTFDPSKTPRSTKLVAYCQPA